MPSGSFYFVLMILVREEGKRDRQRKKSKMIPSRIGEKLERLRGRKRQKKEDGEEEKKT